MRVDFYQLGEASVAEVLPQIAAKCLGAGERLLVVSADAAQRDGLGAALWDAPGSFLANGAAGGEHDARQPILLTDDTAPANGATNCALADGVWRDGAGEGAFTRVFLLFGADTLEGARAAWRQLGTREGVERHFWKREGRRWVEGP